ncbi:MAG: hypothetical protein GX895_08765 [Clostridiales bacterium]|nr:hypothetical protein [Clostridiales bacterium]
MGSPATVIGLSQVQFGTPKRYDIELDIGKRATLRADRLKKIEQGGKKL